MVGNGLRAGRNTAVLAGIITVMSGETEYTVYPFASDMGNVSQPMMKGKGEAAVQGVSTLSVSDSEGIWRSCDIFRRAVFGLEAFSFPGRVLTPWLLGFSAKRARETTHAWTQPLSAARDSLSDARSKLATGANPISGPTSNDGCVE